MILPKDLMDIVVDYVSDDTEVYLFNWKNKISNRKPDPKDLDWSDLSRRKYLPYRFIEEHKQYIDWYAFTEAHMNNHSLLLNFKKHIPWNEISKKRNLPSCFIRAFENYLNWDYLSLFCNLDNEILSTKGGRINWMYLKYNQNISVYYLNIMNSEFDEIRDIINSSSFSCASVEEYESDDSYLN